MRVLLLVGIVALCAGCETMRKTCGWLNVGVGPVTVDACNVPWAKEPAPAE